MVVKIRIEGETADELDVAEALLRLVFTAGPASQDYRNRRRRQGDQRVPGWRRYVDDNVKPITRLSLYAVVFSNYEPAEVDSVHITRELAGARLDQLDGMWKVEEWTVDLASLVRPPADDDDESPATSSSPASTAVVRSGPYAGAELRVMGEQGS